MGRTHIMSATNENCAPIRPGDLVMVVKPTPCCGGARRVGKLFVAGKIRNIYGICPQCGVSEYRLSTYNERGRWDVLTRLKRIPPLSELEGEKRDEEITA